MMKPCPVSKSKTALLAALSKSRLRLSGRPRAILTSTGPSTRPGRCSFNSQPAAVHQSS